MNRLIGAVALASLASACGAAPPVARSAPKLVILGFEGMDPNLTTRLIAQGKLPNLAKLAAQSGFALLEPGPARPWVSPLWGTVDRANIRSSILYVPGTFPPPPLEHGELLSGFPLPDVRATAGTYYYFASNVTRKEEGPTKLGGIVKRLVFTKNVAGVEMDGPRNPDAPEFVLRVPLTIQWNHEPRTANVAIAGDTIHLAEKQWSKWIPIDFEATRSRRFRAMAQFFLDDAGQALQLHVSPLHWHPSVPLQPISSPPQFAADIFERLGPYRTLGHPEAAAAFAEGRLDENTFMSDLERAFDERAETILNRVDTGRWDLLAGVIESIDRLEHVMDTSIERVYLKADQLVGDVVQRLPPEATIIVLSSHGNRDTSPGIFVSNRKPTAAILRMSDLAPTVLKYFGIPIPKETDGKALF